MKLSPRYYQQEAVDSIFDYYQSEDAGHSLVCLPTATGKSLVQSMIAEKILKEFSDCRIKTVAADEGIPNWIKYSLPTGGSFCNINSKSKAKGYTSKQLYDMEYFELAMKTDDEGFKAIQKDKEETKKIKGLI